jgi:hypothetical protein
METETTRRVLTEATIESFTDIFAAQHDMIPADQARRVVVPGSLADINVSAAGMRS